MSSSSDRGGWRLRSVVLGAALVVILSLEWFAGAPVRVRSGPARAPSGAAGPSTPGLEPAHDGAAGQGATSTRTSSVVPPFGVAVATARPVVDEGFARVVGHVVHAGTGEALAGASVSTGSHEATTDADGRFAVGPVAPGAALLVRLPGYEKVRLYPQNADLTIRLRPQLIKAAYLTYYGVGDREIRTRTLDLIEATELNAVVIDVKGDRGIIPYRTTVPLALEVGAQGPVIIRDMRGFVGDLKARHIYTIARIVSFKDTVLAHHRKDLAIIDRRTGQPWTDREQLAWVDPFREEVWRYLIAVAKEAVDQGFDEIQFDYVRFPTDGKLVAAHYSRENTQETRLATIAAFLAMARRELHPLGVFVAADLFGYTAFNTNDTDIGQRLEEIAPNLDYISIMAYPSGYHLGIPGYRNPVQHPYQIVYESVKRTRERTGGLPVKVRPWIQDFRDYAFDRRVFGPADVRAQIRGAEASGATGWMLWNPGNRYTAEALRPSPAAAIRPAAEGR